jgi:hypothetical protein
VFQLLVVNDRVLTSNVTALAISATVTVTVALGFDESLTVKDADCPSVREDADSAETMIDAVSTSRMFTMIVEPALPTDDEHEESLHTPTESYRESVDDGIRVRNDCTAASFSKMLSVTAVTKTL